MHAAFGLALMLATSFAGALETPAQRETRFARLERKIGNGYDAVWKVASKIRPGRVNDEQAFVLGQAYFYAYVSGCGALRLPIDNGKDWMLTTVVGAAPRPAEAIFVNKATGATWTPHHRTVTSPAVYLKLISK